MNEAGFGDAKSRNFMIVLGYDESLRGIYLHKEEI